MTGEACARAEAALDLGRLDEAERLARDGLRADPNDADLHGLLAHVLAKTGRGTEAVECSVRALALRPDDPTLVQVHALALVVAGKHAEGVSAARLACSLNPHGPESRLLLAFALLHAGSARRRKGARRKLLREAEAHAKAVVAQHPAAVGAHLMTARTLAAQKKFYEADEFVDVALRLDPVDADAHELRGVIAHNRGDVTAAGDAYLTAAKLDPSGSSALDRLRLLGRKWWWSGALLFLVARLAALTGRASAGDVPWSLVAFMALGVGGIAWWLRSRTKGGFSREARAVLAADTRLRRRRRFGR